MRFELYDELIIVDIDGIKCLVDTGSPQSFSLKNSSVLLNLNGKTYPLHTIPQSKNILESLRVLIPDVSVDCFIGGDILSMTNLSVDYQNQEIYFEVVKALHEDNCQMLIMKQKNNWPMISIAHNGYYLDTALDTGAKYTFIKSRFLNLNEPVGKYVDHSPIAGAMSGNLYNFYDPFNQEVRKVGTLPVQFESQCDGVISVINFVNHGFCSFDYKNGKFLFTKK